MKKIKVDWETYKLWQPRHPERTAWRALSKTYVTDVEIVEFTSREEMVAYVNRWDRIRAAGWRSLGGGWKFYVV